MSTSVERRQDTEAVEIPATVTRRRRQSVAPRPLNAAMMFAVVALSITVIGLLYLVQTAQVASLGYELTRLERERAAVAIENQQLTYAVANYESLPRVELRATGDLAMQPIDDYRFLVVPLPPTGELSVPDPLTRPEQSLSQRVWERLTGQSTATNTGGLP